MKFSCASNSTASSPFKPTMADDRAACARLIQICVRLEHHFRWRMALGISKVWAYFGWQRRMNIALIIGFPMTYLYNASRRRAVRHPKFSRLMPCSLKHLAALAHLSLLCTAPDKIDRKLLKNILGRNFLRLTDRPRAHTHRQAPDRLKKSWIFYKTSCWIRMHIHRHFEWL